MIWAQHSKALFTTLNNALRWLSLNPQGLKAYIVYLASMIEWMYMNLYVGYAIVYD